MERTIFINLILLDKNERRLDNITGRATQGSISINGSSSLRRTCNITLIPEVIDFNKYLWTLNNKFKVEIGVLQNDDTIKWYPQGIYAITTFSASFTANNYQVSIQGQDKMVFLNGTIGGHIGVSLDAGREEIEQQNGIIVYRDRPLKEIILDVVHKFGGEPYHNIIINDLEESGKILQSYAYNKNLYLGRKKGQQDYRYAFWGDRKFKANGREDTLDNFAKDESIIFDYTDSLRTGYGASTFSYASQQFNIVHFSYGDTVGYKNTELTYPGELIANPGDTVSSILDKIVQMLGEFEYFYNLAGQLIFQRKKIYANAPFSPYDKQLGWIDLNAQKLAYTFPNLESVSSFNNTYGLNNVKNDFSIWGERTGIGGGKIPIHLRYVIDNKPRYYKTITVPQSKLDEYNKKYGLQVKSQIGRIYQTHAKNTYIDDQADVHKTNFYLEEETLDEDQKTQNVNSVLKLSPVFVIDSTTKQIDLEQTPVLCDWREIIYQMARDYTKYGHLDDFQYRVAQANASEGLYADGTTGYEKYYLDIEGFWRELYNPWAYAPNRMISDKESFEKIKAKETLYYRGDMGKIFIPVGDEEYDKSITYYSKDTTFYGDESSRNFPWNKDIFYAPHKLNFWFDFLDTQGAMSKFSVKAIGSRTLVDTKSKVTAIHYGEVPNLLFLDDTSTQIDNTTAYVNFQLGDYADMFVTSSQGSSAKEVLDSLLLKHTLATETVSMQAAPIYDLDPNSLVQITAMDVNINGEYIINSLTIPLTYNGMMSINALKCSVFESNDAAAILGQAVLGIMLLGTG